MTGDKNSFVQLDEGVKSNITLGDRSTQEVTGKGTISVKARNGSTKYIQDVLYVPGLAQNLLSVGQLIEKGYSVNFDNNKCVIFDKKKAQVIASISMLSNKIFPLKMPVEQKAALSSILENSSLWHQRYGHLNPASLKVLQRRNMVIGLPSLDIRQNICEGCIMGKMHRFPFTNTSQRAKAPLQLVHADIWGPTQHLSMGGKRYFLLFVDDYTRMMWVYFLEQK